MAAPKNRLSHKDKKTMDVYTNALVNKCVQVIVQSRFGERTTTRSSPEYSKKDWFHLNIQDTTEISSEAKKAMSNGMLTVGKQLCVQISLHTSEGEIMVLETWCIKIDEQSDVCTDVLETVYDRMSVLLKSLLSFTRATPAYRLSMNQGSESYIICYWMYASEPDNSNLGSGYQLKTVGRVPSPLGTINVTVAFRTKMLISPHSSKELVTGVRDDHFPTDINPNLTNAIPKPCCQTYKEPKPGVTDEGFAMEDSARHYYLATSPPDVYCAAGYQDFATSPPSNYLYTARSPPNRAYSPADLSNSNVSCPSSTALARQCNSQNDLRRQHMQGDAIEIRPKVIKSNGLKKGVTGFHCPENDENDDLSVGNEQYTPWYSDGESDKEDDPTPAQYDVVDQFNEHLRRLALCDDGGDHVTTTVESSSDESLETGFAPLAEYAHAEGGACAMLLESVTRVRHTSANDSMASSPASNADDFVKLDFTKPIFPKVDDSSTPGDLFCEMMDAETPAFLQPRPIRLYPNNGPLPEDGEVPVNLAELINEFEHQGHEFNDFVKSFSMHE